MAKTKHINKKRGGFSLLETTAAIFVLTMGVFTSFDLYYRSMDGTKTMVEERVALSILRSEVAWLQAEEALVPGEYPLRGTTTMLEQLFDGEGQVVLKARDDLATGLVEATVQVQWRVRSGRLVVRELTTLIAGGRS